MNILESIGLVLKNFRDLIQLLILLLILIVVMKLFSLPKIEDISDWINYRRAIAHIERKDESVFSFRGVKETIWRGNLKKNPEKAIELLCVLGTKGKEEAELLLLIYNKDLNDCPKPKPKL